MGSQCWRSRRARLGQGFAEHAAVENGIFGLGQIFRGCWCVWRIRRFPEQCLLSVVPPPTPKGPGDLHVLNPK